MIRNNWKEKNEYISRNVENKRYIDEKSLLDLNNLYKLVYDNKTNTLFDTKRGKSVVVLLKNPLNDEYDIAIDSEWLYKEAITTGSHTLQKIIKRNPGLYDIKCRLDEHIRVERAKFMKSIIAWQLNIREKSDELEEIS